MLESRYAFAHAPDHDGLEWAVAETAKHIPVSGLDVLAVWVEKVPAYPKFCSYFLKPHDIVIDSRWVTPGTFAHEYAHFLDLELGLRDKWFRVVSSTPEYQRWKSNVYLSHPGEMVARFVEQMVAPDEVNGAYGSTTFEKLRPVFLEMLLDAL